MRRTRLLGAVALLVPEHRRAAWRREWEAELAHLDEDLRAVGRGRWARRLAVHRYALDAVEDAVGMRRRHRRSFAWTRDLRLAMRALARSPGYALLALVTLGLGVGANTAVFSVVRSVLLRPLPYEEPDRVVYPALSFRDLESGAERRIAASEPEYLDLLGADVGFEALGNFYPSDVNFGGGEEPLRVPAAYVSADFLDLLGVAPARGRAFVAGEDRPGAAPVAILSDGLWRRAFGADVGVVGRDVLVQGRSFQVVGVLPPEFVFPSDPVDLLLPNTIDPADPAGRSSHYMFLLARLADGVTLDAAQARLDATAARWGQSFPDRHGMNPTHPVTLVPIQEQLVGDTGPMLLLVLGAVGLVLLIACANVASLTMVRMERRRAESGIRLALGGGRADVVGPALAEGMLVAVGGGVVGLALAAASLGAVERLGPDVLARVGGVRIDRTVLAFTAGVALLSTLLFALGPAVAAARTDPARSLRAGGGRGATARRDSIRRGIVVGEIALALVLVVGSGLLLRNFAGLQATDPGFDTDGRVTLQFTLSAGDYPEMAQVAAFHRALADRVRDLPGVRAYGTIRALPFAERPGMESITPADRPVAEDDMANAWYQIVTPGWFEAMDVPLVRGRFLAGGDETGAVVINRTMAEAFWPGEDAIGRSFQHGWPGSGTPALTVVGIVEDFRQGGYEDVPGPTMFVPLAQATAIYGGLGTRTQTAVLATDLPPADALRLLAEAVHAVDPGLPVARATTLDGVMVQSVAGPRFLTLLVGAFSVLALVLGAVGVGGVVAYTVAQRRRELGLRMALGARGGDLVRGVLGQAAALTAAGVVLGLAGAWAASGLLAEQLHGSVGPRDPVAFIVAPLVLFVVAVGAAAVPARRATGIDPVTAMRAE